jgi:hypothetical protein
VSNLLLLTTRNDETMLYSVKWKGYAAEANTWEPASSFFDPSPVADYWRLVQFKLLKLSLQERKDIMYVMSGNLKRLAPDKDVIQVLWKDYVIPASSADTSLIASSAETSSIKENLQTVIKLKVWLNLL